MNRLTQLLLRTAIALAVTAVSAADLVPDFAEMRGVNYVPSYARNDVQIWMDYDPVVIDRELGYAEKLKLNVVRVFLQVAVYERDPKQFLDNLDNFLGLCEKHHIQLMPVIFDSCFGEFPDLQEYREKDWMACPGQNRIGQEHWPFMEKYVEDVVGGHKDDRRIVMWDVMNEPLCTLHARTEEGREKIWGFLDHMLDVVRSRQPMQPLTVGFMASGSIPRVIDKIDVLGWHNYTGDMNALRADIRRVKEWGREHSKPLVINEIARRNTAQDFWRFMPVLEQEQIGWCFWELMLGKTQFSRGDNPIQGVVYPDGTSRDAREITAILHPAGTDRDAKQVAAAAGLPQRPRPRGEIRDTDDVIRYSNGWTAWRGNGPRYGTLHYANQSGCTAEMAFDGTAVNLIHKIGPDCGIAAILLDGSPAPLAARVDSYGREVQWGARTPLAKGLAPGRHTVTVRVTGQKRAESANTYVQIVGFEFRDREDNVGHESSLK